MPNDLFKIAKDISGVFSQHPEVVAIVVSGSVSAGRADELSDIDLVVYVNPDLPSIDTRTAMISTRSTEHQINANYWETEDDWIERETGISVDVIYRRQKFVQQDLQRVIIQHQASLGYTTALWSNIVHSTILFDRTGWFEQLQEYAHQTYPESLRRGIIFKNYAVLRDIIGNYVDQIKIAVHRGDLVSVNHRVAAFLASYFDILFALNRVLHPGEKRLLELAETQCSKRPIDLREHITMLLNAAGTGANEVVALADQLASELGALLRQEGLID